MASHRRKRKNYDDRGDRDGLYDRGDRYERSDRYDRSDRHDRQDKEIIYDQIYSTPKKNKPRCMVVSNYKDNLLSYFQSIIHVDNVGINFSNKWYIHFYRVCLYNEKLYAGASASTADGAAGSGTNAQNNTNVSKKNIDKLIIEYNVEEVLRKVQTLVVRKLDCENLYYQKILVLVCLLFDFFQNKKHVNVKTLRNLEGEEEEDEGGEGRDQLASHRAEGDHTTNGKKNSRVKESKKRSRTISVAASSSNYGDDDYDDITNHRRGSSKYEPENEVDMKKKKHLRQKNFQNEGQKNYYIIEFKNLLFNEKKKFNNIEIFYHITNLIIHKYWYSSEFARYNIFVWFLNYLNNKLEIKKSINKINEQLEMFINIHPKIFNISHAKKRRKKNTHHISASNSSYHLAGAAAGSSISNHNSAHHHFENGVLDYPNLKNRSRQLGGGFSDATNMDNKNKPANVDNMNKVNTFGNFVNSANVGNSGGIGSTSFFGAPSSSAPLGGMQIATPNVIALPGNNSITSNSNNNSNPFKGFNQSNNIFSSSKGNESSLFRKSTNSTSAATSLFGGSLTSNSIMQPSGNSTLPKFTGAFSGGLNAQDNSSATGPNPSGNNPLSGNIFGMKSSLMSNNTFGGQSGGNLGGQSSGPLGNSLMNNLPNQTTNLFDSKNNSSSETSNLNLSSSSNNRIFGFEKSAQGTSLFANANGKNQSKGLFPFGNNNQAANPDKDKMQLGSSSAGNPVSIFGQKSKGESTFSLMPGGSTASSSIGGVSGTSTLGAGSALGTFGGFGGGTGASGASGGSLMNNSAGVSLKPNSVFQSNLGAQKEGFFGSAKPNENIFGTSSAGATSSQTNIFGMQNSSATNHSPFSKTANTAGGGVLGNVSGNISGGIGSSISGGINGNISGSLGLNNPPSGASGSISFGSSLSPNQGANMGMGNNLSQIKPSESHFQPMSTPTSANNLANLFNSENGSKELFKDLKLSTDTGQKFSVNKKPLFSKRVKNNTLLTPNNNTTEENNIFSSNYVNKDSLLINQDKPVKVIFGQNKSSSAMDASAVGGAAAAPSLGSTNLFGSSIGGNNISGSATGSAAGLGLSGGINDNANNNQDKANNNNLLTQSSNQMGSKITFNAASSTIGQSNSATTFGKSTSNNLFGSSSNDQFQSGTNNLFGNNQTNENTNSNGTSSTWNPFFTSPYGNKNDTQNNNASLSIPVKKLTLEERKKKTAKSNMLSLFSNNNMGATDTNNANDTSLGTSMSNGLLGNKDSSSVNTFSFNNTSMDNVSKEGTTAAPTAAKDAPSGTFLFGQNRDTASSSITLGTSQTPWGEKKTSIFGSATSASNTVSGAVEDGSNKEGKGDTTSPNTISSSNPNEKSALQGGMKSSLFSFGLNKTGENNSAETEKEKPKSGIFGFGSINVKAEEKEHTKGEDKNEVSEKDKSSEENVLKKNEKENVQIFGSAFLSSINGQNKDANVKGADSVPSPFGFGNTNMEENKTSSSAFMFQSNKEDRSATPIFGLPSKSSSSFNELQTSEEQKKIPIFSIGGDTKQMDVATPQSDTSNVFKFSATGVDTDGSALGVKAGVGLRSDNINYDDVKNRKRRRNVDMDDQDETAGGAKSKGRDSIDETNDWGGDYLRRKGHGGNHLRDEINEDSLIFKKSKLGSALTDTKNILNTLKFDNIPSKDILSASLNETSISARENNLIEGGVLNNNASLWDSKEVGGSPTKNKSESGMQSSGIFSPKGDTNQFGLGNSLSNQLTAETNNTSGGSGQLKHHSGQNHINMDDSNFPFVTREGNNLLDDHAKRLAKQKEEEMNKLERLKMNNYLVPEKNENDVGSSDEDEDAKALKDAKKEHMVTDKKSVERIVAYNKKISFDDIEVDLDKDIIDLNDLRQNLFLCVLNFHLNYWAEKVILFYPHNEKINKFCNRLMKIKNEFDETYNFNLFEEIHVLSKKLLKRLDRNCCIYESVLFLSAENIYVLKNAKLSLFEAFNIYHFWFQKNSLDVKKNFQNFMYTNKIYPSYLNYYMNLYKNYKSFNYKYTQGSGEMEGKGKGSGKKKQGDQDGDSLNNSIELERDSASNLTDQEEPNRSADSSGSSGDHRDGDPYSQGEPDSERSDVGSERGSSARSSARSSRASSRGSSPRSSRRSSRGSSPRSDRERRAKRMGRGKGRKRSTERKENSLIEILNSNSSEVSDVMDNSNKEEPLNMHFKEKYLYLSKGKARKNKLFIPSHIRVKKLSACECILLELILKRDILSVLKKYKILKTEKYEYLYVNLIAMLKHYNYFSLEKENEISKSSTSTSATVSGGNEGEGGGNTSPSAFGQNKNNPQLKKLSNHLNTNCVNTKNDKINILKKICDRNLLYYINMQLKNITHLISLNEMEIACVYLNHIKNNLYVMFQMPILLYNTLFDRIINSYNDYIIMENFFNNSCLYNDFRYENIFKTKVAYMLMKKFFQADDTENCIRFALYFENIRTKAPRNNIYNDYIFHKNLLSAYIKVHEDIVPEEWIQAQTSNNSELSDLHDSEYLDYYSFFFKDISKYIKFNIMQKIVSCNIFSLRKRDYTYADEGCSLAGSFMVGGVTGGVAGGQASDITSGTNIPTGDTTTTSPNTFEDNFACYFVYMVNRSILDDLVNLYASKGDYFYKRISATLINSSLVKEYEKTHNKHFHMHVQVANINHFMKTNFFEYINFFKKKELYHIDKTKNEDEIMQNLVNVIKGNGKKIIVVINMLVEIITKMEKKILKNVNIFITINLRNLIIDTFYLFKYIFNNKEFSLHLVEDMYRNAVIFNDLINSTFSDDVHYYPKEQIKELYTYIRHKFTNQNLIA
ncbi:hypothetical protein AK88_04421 [Plasmodium fragile]|uniref:Nucleoporin NUP313 n=1 Tax=Plasmodium fragile TaxID=5857 RepID=A0A0D9QJN6_PLAFR|nr:uncharacterized protein AK88_04421 [Plasmodium fragile]KJP85946.1 hypothetical protein AK88_04421 [Plasmodium fragile]